MDGKVKLSLVAFEGKRVAKCASKLPVATNDEAGPADVVVC